MPTATRKAAYLAAADACRWAASEGLGACDGWMIDREYDREVSVCVLGAMALRRAMVDRACEDFNVVYDDILHGSMQAALGMGSLSDAVAVSDRFDAFFNSDILPIEPGKAEVFWRRAAAMFDNLATD